MPETKKKPASAPAAAEPKTTPAPAANSSAAASPAEASPAPAASPVPSAPAATPQAVVPMMAPVEPNVSIIYLDTVMPGNRIEIGRGRVITGSGRRFSVPLSYFEGEFMTPLTSRLLQRRSFLVLDGLTDAQRELYGCLYRPGEVVFSEGSFQLFFSESEELLPTLAALCPEHRDMVLNRVLTAHGT